MFAPMRTIGLQSKGLREWPCGSKPAILLMPGRLPEQEKGLMEGIPKIPSASTSNRQHTHKFQLIEFNLLWEIYSNFLPFPNSFWFVITVSPLFIILLLSVSIHNWNLWSSLPITEYAENEKFQQ